MNLNKKIEYYNYYFESLSEISIDYAKSLLNSNDLNKLTHFYKLMITRDAHLYAQINKRQTQIASTPIKFTFKSDKHAEFYKKYFSEDNRLQTIIQNLLTAIVYGFSISDLVWDTKDNAFIPELYLIPQTSFYADKDGTYLLQRNQKLYIEDNDKFLIHFHTTESANITDLSILKKLIWVFTIKSYVIANYAKYISLLGVPPVIVQHDTDKASEIVDAVIDLRSAGVGAFPKDAIITLLEGKGSPDIFNSFINYIDDIISQVVLGSTLTSKIGSTGSYAAAKIHNEIRLDYLKLDAVLIENSINNLIRKIHKFNFNDTDYPQFKFDSIEYVDEKTRAETLQILANMGIKIPDQYIYDAFNIPTTNEEKIIQGNSRKIGCSAETNIQLPADDIDKHILNAKFLDIEKDILQTISRLFKTSSSYSEAISALIAGYPEIRIEKLENILMKYIANATIYGNTEHD